MENTIPVLNKCKYLSFLLALECQEIPQSRHFNVVMSEKQIVTHPASTLKKNLCNSFGVLTLALALRSASLNRWTNYYLV